jgi:hypothetical protein
LRNNIKKLLHKRTAENEEYKIETYLIVIYKRSKEKHRADLLAEQKL